jgi:polysaccharide pyruvyl transferase WcaK-like protein
MNILIVGYYDHHNLGDEQYKISIKYIIKQLPNSKPKSIEFIDCDCLQDYKVLENTTIIFGGGDILNHYFLDKLNKKFQDILSKPRIIAFSVGIPYNSIFLEEENLKKLHIFDYIFLRTHQDILLLSQYFGENNVSYIPDSSCFIFDAITQEKKKEIVQTKTKYTKIYSLLSTLSKSLKIININLCRHIHHINYKENYINIIKEIAVFLNKLTDIGFLLVLLPFNTKPSNNDELNNENDILIQNDVFEYIKKKDQVINIDFPLTIKETLSFYPHFYMSIPMRFHGTLFSIFSEVPMVPIYTTKKIKNILLDIGWNYEYLLDKNDRDLPISFDADRMMNVFNNCIKDRESCKKILNDNTTNFKKIYKDQENAISNIIYKKPFITKNKEENTLSLIPLKLPQKNGEYLYKDTSIIDNINPIYSKKSVDEEIIEKTIKKIETFAMENGYTDFREITDNSLKSVIVSVVSFYLTNSIDSKYSHGLMEKMFSMNFVYQEEWKWILQDDRKKNILEPIEALPENPDGIFNISFIDQNDRSGAHRSGWKYVFDSIKRFNNSNASVLLDLYIDRTFHWKREIYKNINIIPYKKPWLGFIHHTFDTTFSKFNSVELLKCSEFIESLKVCKGIIVLSNYLKNQFEREFSYINIKVPIYVIYHPTEINVPQFNLQDFFKNPDKKLINIGGWLRNIFSFYQVQLEERYSFILYKEEYSNSLNNIDNTVGNNIYKKIESYKDNKGKNTNYSRFLDIIKKAKKCIIKKEFEGGIPNICTNKIIREDKIRKVILKGKYMNNYFPTPDFIKQISDFIINIDYTNQNPNNKFCSKDDVNINNNWIKHMTEYLFQLPENLEILDTVDNKMYDDLLTKNLVFLNLVDGSAVNTVIECFVRNTPIIVNHHPAVVEILGENYPLYYKSHYEVGKILENTNIIESAYLYMKAMDKKPFTIGNFINKLLTI